ncbi:hypothetical protein PR048_033593, partial [Dryococelus australis]
MGQSQMMGDDLNVTIKARNTNMDLNSTDIVREEDVGVKYLVRCSKEHDLLKEIQTVLIMSA